MKKHALILLAAAILLSLAACGAGTGSGGSKPGATVISAAPPVTLSSEPVVFEPFTAIDNDVCTVTVKAVDPHSANGFAVTLELVNKTAGMTCKFSAVDACINGVAASPELEAAVAPGEKLEQDLLFMQLGLRESGMTLYTDIRVTIKVSDNDNWLAEPAVLEEIRLYPYGESRAEAYARQPQETDLVLAENDDVTVIYLGVVKDFVWGYTPKLFVQNKSGSELLFTLDDAAVNGKPADLAFAVKLQPGTCAYETVYGIDSSLNVDIAKLKEVSFVLRVHDADDYSLPDSFRDTVILHP